MPSLLYANGQIPESVLDPVPAANGQTAWLLPLVAASFLRARAKCADIGFNLLITSAGDGFRSYSRQVNVFLERYERSDNVHFRGPYGDVRWWQGKRYVRMRGAAAAVPGTSNHGKAITSDLTGLGGYGGYWFRKVAPILISEGWSNAEGARINESWHWNQMRTAYHVIDTNIIPGVSLPWHGGVLPAPLTKEFTLMDDDSLHQLNGSLEQTRREVLEGVRVLLGTARGDRQADLQQTREEVIEGVLRAVQGASSPEVVTTVYRVEGTYGCWQDLGVARRYLSEVLLSAIPNHRIEDIKANDIFWRLPIHGGVGELIRKTGTEAAWLLEEGSLRWVDSERYALMGYPVITDVAEESPVWSLPTVGTTP